MKKIGLGLIGLGYIGNIHLRHSLKMPNVNLVAVSDLSKKALKDAKNAGIKKTFTHYEQLLKDPQIDAIIIALPTHLHLQCVKQAADSGKHIFLEKPIARNVEEAKEIISTAKRNSVKLMMGYHLRFNKSFCELKAKMESRVLGDIEIAYATFISSGPFFHRAAGHTPIPVPAWWFDKDLTGGGALMDVGCHMINLLRWYFGEITDIKGYFGKRFNLDFEDSAICFTKFKSGTSAIITAGYFSQGYQLSLEFFGTTDHAFAQHRPGNRLVSAVQMLSTGRSEFYRSHFDELQYFVNCLIKDLSPSPSGYDGLKDIEAISLAYKNKIHLE
jgi:predicted dehydrogenase